MSIAGWSPSVKAAQDFKYVSSILSDYIRGYLKENLKGIEEKGQKVLRSKYNNLSGGDIKWIDVPLSIVWIHLFSVECILI